MRYVRHHPRWSPGFVAWAAGARPPFDSSQKRAGKILGWGFFSFSPLPWPFPWLQEGGEGRPFCNIIIATCQDHRVASAHPTPSRPRPWDDVIRCATAARLTGSCSATGLRFLARLSMLGSRVVACLPPRPTTQR